MSSTPPPTPEKLAKLHDDDFVDCKILVRVAIGAIAAAVLLAASYGTCSCAALAGGNFCKALADHPPWTLVSGIAAVPSLILLWRWRTVQRAKELNQAEQSGMSARFHQAASALGDEKPIARIAGVYALKQVALDSPGVYGVTVIDTLCIFVRQNCEPDPRDQINNDDDSSTRPEASVRAALKVLGSLPDDNAGRVRLEDLDLVCADLSFAQMERASFYGSNMWNANLMFAKLHQADFNHARLPQANLRSADLSKANLFKADLEAADLKNAKLHAANFTEANLADARLQGADLRLANLEGARLQGAVLDRACLMETDLSRAKYDGRTRFPDGFDPQKAGMTPAGG